MKLRRTLAFIFPPIRKVVETRDRLFEEIQLANARICDLEQTIHANKLISTDIQTRSSNSLQIAELDHSKLLSDLHSFKTSYSQKLRVTPYCLII